MIKYSIREADLQAIHQVLQYLKGAPVKRILFSNKMKVLKAYMDVDDVESMG